MILANMKTLKETDRRKTTRWTRNLQAPLYSSVAQWSCWKHEDKQAAHTGVLDLQGGVSIGCQVCNDVSDLWVVNTINRTWLDQKILASLLERNVTLSVYGRTIEPSVRFETQCQDDCVKVPLSSGIPSDGGCLSPCLLPTGKVDWRCWFVLIIVTQTRIT